MPNPKGTRNVILHDLVLDDLKRFLSLSSLIKGKAEKGSPLTQKSFIEVAVTQMMETQFKDLQESANKKGINLEPFLEEFSLMDFKKDL